MNNKPAFPCNLVDDSLHLEGMTLREYAAIRLKVPDSGNPELDKMIRASLRNDLAAKAMQGFAASDAEWQDNTSLAACAYSWADAMLAESGK